MFLYQLTGFFQFFIFSAKAAFRKSGKIQFFFSFFNMIIQPPVNRGDFAIPGIIGMIGMTVITRCFKQMHNTIRYLYHMCNIGGCFCGSIVMWWLKKL